MKIPIERRKLGDNGIAIGYADIPDKMLERSSKYKIASKQVRKPAEINRFNENVLRNCIFNVYYKDGAENYNVSYDNIIREIKEYSGYISGIYLVFGEEEICVW